MIDSYTAWPAAAPCNNAQVVYMRLFTSLALISISLVPAGARALDSYSPIPYTAQFQESSSGKTPFLRIGIKARSSNGNTVEQDFAPGGNTVVKESLYDASSHIAYSLDMRSKTALGKAITMGHMHPPKENPLGYEVLNGVSTTIYPVSNGESHSVDGKIWFADGTDIIIKIAINLPLGGGTYLYQLTNVKIGSEPDGDAFAIPSDFSISKPVN